MAQHDYDIANQSGANFRADLNNALDAIVSNNSGSSEPSTTFAYEWWIDTSANVLKLRNSANNAWITLPLSITADNSTSGALTVNGNLSTTGTLDVNGGEIILDSDADTSITADTDDQIDIKIAGADVYTITASSFDFNGKELILDADADSSITADTDDQIDIKIGGTDVITLTDSHLILKGTTPKITIGDGGAEDTALIFDGNAQDVYLALYDTSDNFVIGYGNTVGANRYFEINSSGNAGLGHTPNSWVSDDTILQGKAGLSAWNLWGRNGSVRLGANHYYNGTNYVYTADGGATSYEQITQGTNGYHVWLSANSGSAGGTFSLSERMRIDSSGEIHINKTSTINNGQLEILAQANHQAIVAKVQTNTNNNFLGYNSSGQVTTYISGNGNYYFSGTNQSDRDLKENIQSITESSLAKVKQLEPKTFNFKESEGFKTNKKTGFIAQEVAEIFGTENGVATGTDGKKDMGIDSVGLIAHLTKAIQEQQTIIDDLKSRIETLEG